MSDPTRPRPLWLLDIDGVVNALARGSIPDLWPDRDWVQRVVITDIPERGVMSLPILAARPVLDFITGVHESGQAEIRWHSTWRTAAVTAFAPTLGLPTSIAMSVAPEWTDRPIATWWKLPAAERAIAQRRPLVWTDDDLRVYRDDVVRLSGRDALLLSPRGEDGLGPDDLERIAGFLQQH